MSAFPDMSLPLPEPAGTEPAAAGLPWPQTGAVIDLQCDGHPWHIAITWGLVDGRPEPVGITLHRGCQPAADGPQPLGDGPAPITAGGWRSIPVGALIRGMRAVMEQANEAHADTIASAGTHPVVGHAREAVQRSRERPRTAGRPRVIDGEHLRHVAAIYDAAWRRGDDPTRAVAEQLVISRSAAAKQIAAARAAGHLPATTRGVAKGNPQT